MNTHENARRSHDGAKDETAIMQDREAPAAFLYIVSPQHPRTDDLHDRFAQILHQVSAAVNGGFAGIVTGQHFLPDSYHQLQTIPLLCRLAAEVPEDVWIGPTVLLLPLLSPVEVAENLATLDIMTNGRLVSGLGIGYRDVEFQAFNRPKSDRVRLFKDSIAVIRALWTAEEPVPYSESFPYLEGIVGSLRPVQKPSPPVWIAGNADGAVRRAAEIGDAWLINQHASLTTLRRQIRIYRATLAKLDKEWPSVMPIMKEVYVAPTKAQAFDTARPYLEAKFRSFHEWGQGDELPPDDSLDIEFEDLARERFIIGDPSDCIEQFADLQQILGTNAFAVRMGWPGMPQDETMRAIQLFSEEVVPAFKKLKW